MSAAAAPEDRDALLAERYGPERDPRRRRRGILLAVGALALALVGYVLFAWISSRTSAVTVEHVGYTVVDPTLAEVTFNVSAPPDTPLVCTLEAVSATFTQVGYVELPLEPIDGSASVTGRVPTVEPAASATVLGCEAR